MSAEQKNPFNNPFETLTVVIGEPYPGYRPLKGADVFAANLGFLLNATDMSQKKLAERLGKSESFVSKVCNGIDFPKLDVAFQIAETFDVSLEELLSSRTVDTWIVARWRQVRQLVQDPELLKKLTTPAKHAILDVIEEFSQANDHLTSESRPHLLSLLTIESRWKLMEVMVAYTDATDQEFSSLRLE
jgi:transcriptional regulator with XRE-family HTH domain